MAPSISRRPSRERISDHRFDCRQCNGTFTAKKSLYRHLRSVHNASQHICSACGDHSTRKDVLETHVVRKHQVVRSAVALLCFNAARANKISSTPGSLSSGRSLGYPSAGDNPLLVVLRMWDLVYPTQSSSEQSSLSFLSAKHRLTWLEPKDSAIVLIREQLTNEARISQSNALWLALLQFVLMERLLGHGTDDAIQFAGAAATIATRHRLLCGCVCNSVCQRWLLDALVSDPSIEFLASFQQQHRICVFSTPDNADEKLDFFRTPHEEVTLLFTFNVEQDLQWHFAYMAMPS